jgi:hypothetical protein
MLTFVKTELVLCHSFLLLKGWNLSLHYFNYDWDTMLTSTNVMHFSFSLLRIRGLYMFRALLAHPQKVLNKRNLVYCMHITPVYCGTVAVKMQPCHSILILFCYIWLRTKAYIIVKLVECSTSFVHPFTNRSIPHSPTERNPTWDA